MLDVTDVAGIMAMQLSIWEGKENAIEAIVDTGHALANALEAKGTDVHELRFALRHGNLSVEQN